MRTIAFATTLSLLMLSLMSMTLFEKKIGESQCYEEGVSVVPVDGGYLVSGAYNCAGGVQNWKSYLVMLNEDGDTLWTRRDLQVNGEVIPTSDNHFIFIGGNTAGFVYDSIQIAKADMNGDIVWSQRFFYPQCKNMVTDLVETAGGYVVSGIFANSSCSNPMYDSFIMGLDKQGNVVWERIITGLGNDQVHQLAALNDGGVAAFGWSSTKTTQNDANYVLLRYDANGNEMFSKTYGDNRNNYGYGMTLTDDDKLVLTGYTDSTEVMMTDLSGELIWEKTYAPACGGTYFKTTQTHDGGLAFIGSESVNGNCTSFLMKTEKDGTPLWKKNWDAKLRTLTEDSEGYLMMTGYKDYLPDMLVVKFDDSDQRQPKNVDGADNNHPNDVDVSNMLEEMGVQVGIDEDKLEEEVAAVKVYPNPATSQVTIEFSNPNAQQYQLSIYSVSGQMVNYFDNVRGEQIQITRDGLPAGAYTYKITGEGNTYAGRFLFN